LIAENPIVNAEISELTDKVKSIKDKKERIEKTIAQQISVFAEAEKIRKKERMVFKEISERDKKILELYREGLTLRNISEFFGITHERIRQIVITAIKRLAINDSITRGIQLDPEIVLEEEFKKRNNAKLKKKPVIIQTPKEIRWSRYYITCKSCGLTTYPHVRKGLCEKCIGGYRDDRREHIIIEHGNKCDSCGIAREQAISVYNRDLYITKTQNVFCKKCFLLNSGRILGQSSKNRRNKTFS
jgi:ribosomal protein L37E